jgi:allantoin racemase
MRILVINPNSTATMTQKIGECATKFAARDTVIQAVNPTDAPASIEGYFDEAMCLAGLLGEVRKGESAGYDGYVIACFDDTGLNACREIAKGPVLGICEAGMHAASMLASRFSVVTTLPRSIPIIEDLALNYGMERKCRKVRAADIPVLALEEEGSDAAMKVLAEVRRAVKEDGSEAILLGCAGMADLTQWLSKESGVPVIDGVVCAVKMVEALVGAGLKTSKVGAYAIPRIK